jgi:glycine cleavage system H protein
MNPKNLHYSKEHEWLLILEDGNALVGITDFAQERLGDIVYLDLPDIDSKLVKDEKLGEIESVKAVSDIFSPITGSVIEINQEAVDTPQLVNDDPYSKGWLLKILPEDSSQIEQLMSVMEYESMIDDAAS